MTITASILAPAATPAATDAAAGAADLTGAPDGGVSGFGNLLTKSIAERPATDDAAAEDPATRASRSPAPTATKRADGKVDATQVDAREAPDDDGDFNGDDLAAQLALVSQWAGAVVQPRPADAGTATDALDVRGTLDGVRAAVTRFGTTNDLAEQATDGDPATRGELLLNQRANADRFARSTSLLSARIGVEGVATDAKALETARAVTAIGGASLDALTGGASHGATAEGPFAGTLLTQVAAHLAAVTGRATALDGGPTATDVLREQVGTTAWSREVGQAALRLAAGDLQNVSLHLNPEHLGPLDVQLRLANGIAHLQFSAAHPDTRQALESSRPTLDQLFGEQGLKLGDWSVGQQSSHASFARNFGAAHAQGDKSGPGDLDGADATVVTVRATRPLGLVDTFA